MFLIISNLLISCSKFIQTLQKELVTLDFQYRYSHPHTGKDSVYNRNYHHVELTELEDKFKEQVTRLVEETEDNLELINSLAGELDEQNMYVNQLNIKLGQSIQEVEDDVQTIKSSKYGKKIWKVKKKSKKSKMEISNPYPTQDTPQQDTFNNQRP